MILANPSRLQRTAYHEAAHFIFAYGHGQLGRECDAAAISVRPQGEVLGHVVLVDIGLPPRRPARWLRERFVNRLEILFAGPVAQAFRLAVAEVATPTVATVMAHFQTTARKQEDLTNACGIARGLSRGSEDLARALVRDLAARGVARLMRRPRLWAAVATLAAAVVEHEELSGSAGKWVVRHAVRGARYPSLQAGLRRLMGRSLRSDRERRPPSRLRQLVA